ncbi:MAG: calcium-translocating P-type ATPase, SERCA-type [Candidatus Aenigmarchaeota archaeon]|nr:calcium-translocating P-type ATPase, SERCA-type [Candidatus Aenigmarchaeota archaeon]
MDYHHLPAKEGIHELCTNVLLGLSHAEAEARLKKYGLNAIEEKRHFVALKIITEQFTSPLVWILLIAMAISFFMKEMTDFYVIGIVVVLNAVLGFIQNYRAEKAIDALKKVLSLKSTVLRDGQERKIDSSFLVPGDILLVETGDKVGADARLLETVNLETQEAALTGESTPVSKQDSILPKETPVSDRTNTIFSGTVITQGHAKAVVIETGMSTQIGKIARLIQETKPEMTHLQKKLGALAKFIGLAVVLIAVLTFGIGALFGRELFEMFLASIALAVAAIPEGLPAVVTVSLALGVQRMASRNALVRRLPSVETLGACTVICTDKTGTLTHNQMTVQKLFVNGKVVGITGSGYDLQGHFDDNPKNFGELLLIGALNNNAKLRAENSSWEVIGDPTEAALLVSAKKAGLNVEELHEKYPRIEEIEFTSERKCMTTVHHVGQNNIAYTKGAPEVVLKMCTKILVNGKVMPFTSVRRTEILHVCEEFAKDALRVLGFAYKPLAKKESEIEKNMTFVGLQAMIDPPREEVKTAIEKCKTAGIKVVMITGDHLTTAAAIAKQLGISGKAVTGAELDRMTDFEQHAEHIAVYARVDPAHKLKIIDALKAKGHIVAMTGDGVNDAPALKKADIGIAMGTGTDVAKEASAMVLADDNFATIVNAVQEGRKIFDNIQKYIAFLFSGNVGEVLVVFLSILGGLPLPLIAIHLLWINLMTDALPALALGVDPADDDIMQRPPKKPEKSIFTGMEQYVITYPLLLTIGVLGMFSYYLPDTPHARTVAFTTLVLFELFQAVSCRSLTKPAFSVGIFKNKHLAGAVLLSFTLQISLLYVPALQEWFRVVPLTAMQILLIIGVSSAGFLYLELWKWWRQPAL